MNTLNDEHRQWTLPAGSLVKINGIPYALASETVVFGAMPPQQVVTRPSETGKSVSSVSDDGVAEHVAINDTNLRLMALEFAQSLIPYAQSASAKTLIDDARDILVFMRAG